MGDKNNFNKIGNNHPRGIRFWIPLISLFTGMRLRECCQLFSDDIGIKNGVPVIYIRKDDMGMKKLKNSQCERTVPIHPTLEKIGLINFADRAKADSQKMLFKDVQPNGSGRYSDNASKWFSRFSSQTLWTGIP